MLVALVLPGLLAARPRQLGYSYELDTPGAGVRYRGDISGVVGPSIALPALNMPSVTTMVRPILRTQFQWFLAELSLFIIFMLDRGGGVECFLVSFNHNIFMAVQKTCDKILKLNVESKKCLTTLESNECLRQVNC